LDGWVDVIAFDDIVEKGLKLLRQGGATKLLADIAGTGLTSANAQR